MSESTVTRGVPARLQVSDLLLDPQNPRLPEGADTSSQDTLALALAVDHALTEVGRSMAENGFFEEEPLAVVPSVGSPGKYTVVEGNRRTATLKLLTDFEMRERLTRADSALGREWNQLAAAATSAGMHFSDVPVVQYKERADLLTFLGYRHITGVQPWDPLAKARFVTSLIEDYAMDFDSAARRIGSRGATVREIYLGYKVYCQARQDGVDVSRVENAYGVFNRAMVSSPLKLHIGITPAVQATRDPSLLRAPVPQDKAAELGEFVSWVAGDASQSAVIAESREITDLGRVVASSEALEVLRSTRDLRLAHELTDGIAERIIKNLLGAQRKLEAAVRDVDANHITPGVEEAIQRCSELAHALEEVVQSATHS